MNGLARIRYIGDRPFFMASVHGTGRLVFNRHNQFTKVLPVDVCDFIVRQWSRFFEVKGDDAPVAAPHVELATPAPAPLHPKIADHERRRIAREKTKKLKDYRKAKAEERKKEAEEAKESKKDLKKIMRTIK